MPNYETGAPLEESSDDLFVFPNLRPNLVDPITQVTFDHLDRLIHDLNRSLGIISQADQNDFYSCSPGNEVEPTLKVRRYEGPDGLVRLDLVFINDQGSTVIGLRNDAGTPSHRQQVAGDLIIARNNATTLKTVDDLSQTDLAPFVAKLTDRTQQGDFVNKRRRIITI